MTIKAQTYTAQEALDAIRLAVAADPQNSAGTVVREILALAPQADRDGTRSAQLFIDAIKARMAR